MGLQSFNDYVKRFSDKYYSNEPFWGEIQSATTSTLISSNLVSLQRIGKIKTMPSLPTGVTSFIPTYSSITSSTGSNSCIIAKLIDLGTLNLAGPTFTDGSAMPTVTELGVTRQIASAVFAEVSSGVNSTPGSITITYIDQDGNSAETTSAAALTAASPANTISYVPLNGTDSGVIDITSASRTGGTSPTGTLKFYGYIPLGIVSVTPATAGFTVLEDFIISGLNPVKLDAGDTIGFIVNSTSTKSIFGNIVFVGDK